MNPPSIEEQTPGEAHLDKTRLQATAPEPSAQQSLYAAPTVAPSGADTEPAARLAMRKLNAHPLIISSRRIRSRRSTLLLGRQKIGRRKIKSRNIGGGK
jgi:hypothetical protein